MAPNATLFTAVSSSTRQILLLLRCISFAKKAQVRISQDGLRFSTEEGSVMEAFVHLEKALFTSYTYREAAATASQHDAPESPLFEIDFVSLLETLNIFGMSDTSMSKRSGEYDAFAAHRLSRHAGINAFSNQALGITGTCTFSYDGQGSPLSIHMSEAGVTTTCELTTYEAESIEEIPFDRENLSLKTIMRSAHLLDAIAELSSLSPTQVTISAAPRSRSGALMSLSATGTLGSATVEFATDMASETPVLETYHCPSRTSAIFNFSSIKAAQRAMAAGNKVSIRLDEEGVLSLQFLIEVDAGGAGDGIAFVDFRVVPLVQDEVDEGNESDDS